MLLCLYALGWDIAKTKDEGGLPGLAEFQRQTNDFARNDIAC